MPDSSLYSPKANSKKRDIKAEIKKSDQKKKLSPFEQEFGRGGDDESSISIEEIPSQKFSKDLKKLDKKLNPS